MVVASTNDSVRKYITLKRKDEYEVFLFLSFSSSFSLLDFTLDADYWISIPFFPSFPLESISFVYFFLI